ncbi:MAG TPA: YncE family protein [Bacteroidetes bacterium]|nr:YncE family protein [Bacteroidota bacterium]
MAMKKMRWVWVVMLLTIAACTKENPAPGKYEGGVWILNEGVFNGNNASVSFYEPGQGKVTGEVFLNENLRPLGDVLQSMHIHRGKGYLVVNNSQKVEVVDIHTFRSLHTITDLEYPRYFLGVDENKGYLTDGNYQGRVYVVNLETFGITGQIPAGSGPEVLLRAGDKVFVANSGGWGYDSTLTVIDAVTDEVLQTVEVGHQPVDLALDADGYVWALCQGKVVWTADFSAIEYETPSRLVRVDPATYEVMSLEIGSIGDYFNPKRLALDASGNILYFEEAGGVYALDLSTLEIPAGPLIPLQPYGLEVDPDNGEIYVLTSGGGDQPGSLHRYLPNGEQIQSVAVGFFPNGAVFPEENGSVQE